MCVGFYTLTHPDYALVLCANRDEYLDRPTTPATPLLPSTHSHSNILSGIDIRAGGTWLGITRSGKIAFLTNITEEYKTYGSSRGDLVASFLSSEEEEGDVIDIPRDGLYAGFNLLLLTPKRSQHALSFNATFITNRGGGNPLTQRALTPTEQTHSGLSNGIDGQGAESWPKIQHGLDSFASVMNTLLPNTSEEQLADDLFSLLTWKSSQPPRARSELKNTVEVEPFIIPGSEGFYGTRLATVILVKRTGQVRFIERDRWKLDNAKPVLSPSPQREFRFFINDDLAH
ncbi:NRDE protein-domain-containing protein [Suillus occidentalis]|nr:NRDE protein-domain-containing protein [Suillus occidentalis]